MSRYKLIQIYPGSPKLGHEVWCERTSWSKDWQGTVFYDAHPEFWKKVVEKNYYEILALFNPTVSYPTLFDRKNYNESDWQDALNLEHLRIHSVKRLSDGEIFTIGDNTDAGKILSFKLYNDYLLAKFPVFTWYGITNLKKYKQKLFTTEDGIDIYEGDEYYFIENYEISCRTAVKGKYLQISNYYFSTLNVAEEYILMNKPCLSINDLENLRQQVRKKIGLKLVQSAKDFVKRTIVIIK